MFIYAWYTYVCMHVCMPTACLIIKTWGTYICMYACNMYVYICMYACNMYVCM